MEKQNLCSHDHDHYNDDGEDTFQSWPNSDLELIEKIILCFSFLFLIQVKNALLNVNFPHMFQGVDGLNLPGQSLSLECYPIFQACEAQTQLIYKIQVYTFEKLQQPPSKKWPGLCGPPNPPTINLTPSHSLSSSSPWHCPRFMGPLIHHASLKSI